MIVSASREGFVRHTCSVDDLPLVANLHILAIISEEGAFKGVSTQIRWKGKSTESINYSKRNQLLVVCLLLADSRIAASTTKLPGNPDRIRFITLMPLGVCICNQDCPEIETRLREDQAVGRMLRSQCMSVFTCLQ